MSYESEVLADTPYGLWTMVGIVQGASSVPDSSGNANHATMQDTAAGWTVGQSPVFPILTESIAWAGTSGRYAYKVINASTETVEVLIRPSGIGSGGVDRGIWDTGGGSRYVAVTPTGALKVKFGTTTFTSADAVMVNGTGYHVVVTYDSATGAVKGYVNGVEVVTGTSSTGASLNDFARFPWLQGDGKELAGNYSHYAVYTAVLSPTRVSAHYAALDAVVLSAPAFMVPVSMPIPTPDYPVPIVLDSPAFTIALTGPSATPVVIEPIVIPAFLVPVSIGEASLYVPSADEFEQAVWTAVEDGTDVPADVTGSVLPSTLYPGATP